MEDSELFGCALQNDEAVESNGGAFEVSFWDEKEDKDDGDSGCDGPQAVVRAPLVAAVGNVGCNCDEARAEEPCNGIENRNCFRAFVDEGHIEYDQRSLRSC